MQRKIFCVAYLFVFDTQTHLRKTVRGRNGGNYRKRR